MPKHDLLWHQQDMEDEFLEYKEASGIFNLWSELSDVVYTFTRAKWSGHTDITFPFNSIYFYTGILYMIPKYTLRWRFFRKLGKIVYASTEIHEVRNPKRENKMSSIAKKYAVNETLFKNEARKLRRWSFLLK